MKVEDSVEMWRVRARALVESGMAVNAWCEENGVKRSALFRWLERFRDKEPEVFGGFEAAHAGDGRRNWYEAVRRARAARAAVPAPAHAPSRIAPAAPSGFVEVEVAPAGPCPGAELRVDLRSMTAL